MTSSTNYAGARTAAINAAKDLYGATQHAVRRCRERVLRHQRRGHDLRWHHAAAAAGNKVANPGFESGATSWTQTSGVITNDATKAHAGSWLGWLNGYGTTHTDSLSQSIVIPAATSCNAVVVAQGHVQLRRRRHRPTTPLKVQVVSGTTTTTLATYSNLNKGTVYVQKTLNLSAYVGKTVTLKVVGAEDSSLATSFFVDDFSVTTA